MQEFEKPIRELEDSLCDPATPIAKLNRTLDALGRIYGQEWNRAFLESAQKLYSDLAATELVKKFQVFREHFSERRRSLVALQERLCGDLTRVALSHRAVIGGDVLGLVHTTVQDYWTMRRLGFRGWVALGCDWADLKGWLAPDWLLPIVPGELHSSIITQPRPDEESQGPMPEPRTMVILDWISGCIETSLFEADDFGSLNWPISAV